MERCVGFDLAIIREDEGVKLLTKCSVTSGEEVNLNIILSSLTLKMALFELLIERFDLGTFHVYQRL